MRLFLEEVNPRKWAEFTTILSVYSNWCAGICYVAESNLFALGRSIPPKHLWLPTATE